MNFFDKSIKITFKPNSIFVSQIIFDVNKHVLTKVPWKKKELFESIVSKIGIFIQNNLFLLHMRTSKALNIWNLTTNVMYFSTFYFLLKIKLKLKVIQPKYLMLPKNVFILYIYIFL